MNFLRRQDGALPLRHLIPILFLSFFVVLTYCKVSQTLPREGQCLSRRAEKLTSVMLLRERRPGWRDASSSAADRGLPFISTSATAVPTFSSVKDIAVLGGCFKHIPRCAFYTGAFYRSGRLCLAATSGKRQVNNKTHVKTTMAARRTYFDIDQAKAPQSARCRLHWRTLWRIRFLV